VKPLRLSIQAFGPFAQQQELDFSDLAGHDFFLIHGPTGAGKTSILDAISYALYGETSGGLREARDMRSHFAAPSLCTRVRFEFQLEGRHYCVERSPEQPVPRQKGDGFKKQAASACLWERREGIEVPLTPEKPSAVDAKVQELMGFKAGQFRQVVVLPQGQFQEFLLAGSSERQAILQVLFQTGRYAQITEALSREAQALKSEIRALLAESKQLLHLAEVPNPAGLDAKLQADTEALATLKQERDAAASRLNQTTQELQEGHRIATLVQELKAANEEREALLQRHPEIEIQRSRLERARRAATLNAFALAVEDSRDLEARLRAESVELESRRREAQRHLDQVKAILARAEQQESQRENLRRMIGRLRELEPQLRRLDETREALRQAARERLGFEAELQRKQKHLETLGQSLASLHTRLQELLEEGSQLDRLEFQLQQDRKLRQGRVEAERMEAELVQAQSDGNEAESIRSEREQEWARARAIIEQARHTWERGQAALLASRLYHGDPCPVCGSPNHPQLATSLGLLPTEAELKEGQARLVETEAQLRHASEAANQRALLVQRLKSRREAFLETLGDPSATSSADLAIQEATHRQSLESARRALMDQEPTKRKIQAAQSDKAELETALRELQNLHAQAKSQEDSCRGALNILEGAILSELRVPGALSTRTEQAEASLKTLEHDLQEARTATESASTLLTEAITREDVHQRHLAEATREFGRRREALQAALEAAKFRDVEDFESARRDPATQECMEIEIRAYGEALASAEARQQRAAAQTENQVMPNLEGLAQAHAEAQHQVENAAEAQARLETQLQQLHQHREALEIINTTRLAKERRHSVLAHLAQVARGDEGPRISFERFVQGAILDEVLASASQRLLRMSRGRYTLRRASSAMDFRKNAGLELEVPDAHTGRARAASTLSGGEGFQASLALALGLSDTVQRHAGGVRLDTVFVDEGFGSLDSEALDLALGTLEDLKQEGRLVGIISHLEEVKQRVSARLEVLPGTQGSRAAFRFD